MRGKPGWVVAARRANYFPLDIAFWWEVAAIAGGNPNDLRYAFDKVLGKGDLPYLWLGDQSGRMSDPPTIPQHLCWVEDPARGHVFPTKLAAEEAVKRCRRSETFRLLVGSRSFDGSIHWEQTL